MTRFSAVVVVKWLMILSIALTIISWFYFVLECPQLGRKPGGKSNIFVITPTYKRPEQLAELTQLGQTLMHDGNIFWIIVEDSTSKSELVSQLLDRISPNLLGTVHLKATTPSGEKLAKEEPRWAKVRGVHQRNTALNWILENQITISRQHPGKSFIYFADDDNTYDIRLFDQIRKIRKVGVWPVGLVGKVLYEGPVCDSSKSTILRWRTNYRPDRFCACDMAGFAFSLDLFLDAKNVLFSPKPPGFGMLEHDFLLRLVFHDHSPPKKQSDALTYLEPIVCDEIFVWHTQTKATDLSAESQVNQKIPAIIPT